VTKEIFVVLLRHLAMGLTQCYKRQSYFYIHAHNISVSGGARVGSLKFYLFYCCWPARRHHRHYHQQQDAASSSSDDQLHCVWPTDCVTSSRQTAADEVDLLFVVESSLSALSIASVGRLNCHNCL